MCARFTLSTLVHTCQEYDKYDELHSSFWDALYVIAEHELGEARRRDEADRALLRTKGGGLQGADGSGASTLAPHERGLHPDVEEDIEAMMQGGGRRGSGREWRGKAQAQRG